MTRIIVDCIDGQGNCQCSVIPIEKTTREGMFGEGITEAKRLCGGVKNIITAVVKDINGKTICSLR